MCLCRTGASSDRCESSLEAEVAPQHPIGMLKETVELKVHFLETEQSGEACFATLKALVSAAGTQVVPPTAALAGAESDRTAILAVVRQPHDVPQGIDGSREAG